MITGILTEILTGLESLKLNTERSMSKQQVQATLAGILFGVYPLFLNRTNLKGNIMGATFSLIASILIIPFAIGQAKYLAQTNWWMMIAACLTSAIAMLSMTGFLASSNKESVSLLIILMVVTQAIVAAINQIIQDQKISPKMLVGFSFAVAAIILLNKK